GHRLPVRIVGVQPESQARVGEVERIRDRTNVEAPAVVGDADVPEELGDLADGAGLGGHAVQHGEAELLDGGKPLAEHLLTAGDLLVGRLRQRGGEAGIPERPRRPVRQADADQALVEEQGGVAVRPRHDRAGDVAEADRALDRQIERDRVGLEQALAGPCVAAGRTRTAVAELERVQLERTAGCELDPEQVRLDTELADHQTIRALSTVETRSTASRSTSSTVSSIAACRYWKSWIELKSRKPIPPPPTKPVASESRTLTS